MVAVHYERSEWDECEAIANTLKLGEIELSAAYIKAVAWVSKIPI